MLDGLPKPFLMPNLSQPQPHYEQALSKRDQDKQHFFLRHELTLLASTRLYPVRSNHSSYLFLEQRTHFYSPVFLDNAAAFERLMVLQIIMIFLSKGKYPL